MRAAVRSCEFGHQTTPNHICKTKINFARNSRQGARVQSGTRIQILKQLDLDLAIINQSKMLICSNKKCPCAQRQEHGFQNEVNYNMRFMNYHSEGNNI